MLTNDGQRIIYREVPLPLLLRLFILFLGVTLGTIMPVPYLIHSNWTQPSLILLLAIAIILVAGAAGAFFTIVALASTTELQLDPATGQAVRILRGPVINRRDVFRLTDMQPPELIMRGSEDGDYPILRFRLPTGRWLEMACFNGRAGAEAWRAGISRLMA